MHMQTELTRRWITAAGLTAAALSVVYWTQAGLSARRAPATKPAPAMPAVVAGSADELARVLGAPALAPQAADAALASRFRLAGVLARTDGRGAVLLSVDGQPARTFSVGAEVTPGFWLQTVGPGEAMLAQETGGPVRLTLRVAALAGDSEANEAGAGRASALSAISAPAPAAQAGAPSSAPPSSRRPAAPP